MPTDKRFQFEHTSFAESQQRWTILGAQTASKTGSGDVSHTCCLEREVVSQIVGIYAYKNTITAFLMRCTVMSTQRLDLLFLVCSFNYISLIKKGSQDK